MKSITAKSFLVLASTSAIFSSTIDPEFETLNATQAKLAASNLKKQVAALSALPLVAVHHAGLPGTDTDELIKAVANGSNDTWIAFSKTKITTLISAWIKTLPKAGDTLLVNGVVAAADKRKPSRLISDLERVIDTADYTVVPIPGDPNLSTLKRTKLVTVQTIVDAVNNEIDRILVGGDATNLLQSNIPAVRPANFPTDKTKGAFKVAIEALIKTF